MNYLSQFFNLSYLLNPNPGSHFILFIPLLIFFALLLVLAICLAIFLKKPQLKNLKRYLFNGLISFSLIGFVLLFFRNQEIPYLSIPFLLFLLGLSLLVYLVWLVIYIFKRLPKEFEEINKKLEIERYLGRKR